MEKIHIYNFAGLDNVEIQLNQINIFIGKQASGKSVTAKLIYYFKTIPRNIGKLFFDKNGRKEIFNKLKNQFVTYFPTDTWPVGNFSIKYYYSDEYCFIERLDTQKIKISFSSKANKIFSAGKRLMNKYDSSNNEDEFYELYKLRGSFDTKFNSLIRNHFNIQVSSNTTFIPAGRSFFANLQSSIFSFLSSNNSLDPFLIEFGSTYESIKSYLYASHVRPKVSKRSIASSLCEEIMGGVYHREKDKDFLIHTDKRKVNVAFTSSGQQETLPLLLILQFYELRVYGQSGTTLFIEEPEAHLFPEAQKKIVDLICYILQKSDCKLQIIITTHSPYILSSFNTTLQASKMLKSGKVSIESIFKIVPKHFIFDQNLLSAFAMSKGHAANIIDDETKLVDAEYLDSVSQDIAQQFDNLLDLI